MFDIERWQEIFETLSKNRLRTLLTGLSVASGIFILVILLGFGKGIENGVRSEFERDAVNYISVSTRVTTKEYKGLNPGRYIQLKNEDFNAISDTYEDYTSQKSPSYHLWSALVSYKGESGTYRVQGVSPDYQAIENATIVNGRFLNESDLEESRKVGVIGQRLKLDLFKNEEIFICS